MSKTGKPRICADSTDTSLRFAVIRVNPWEIRGHRFYYLLDSPEPGCFAESDPPGCRFDRITKT